MLGNSSLGVKEGRERKVIRTLPRKAVLGETKPSLERWLPGRCPLPVPFSPAPSAQHYPPGREAQLEAHLSWIHHAGCQLEIRVRWEGHLNLGSGESHRGLACV